MRNMLATVLLVVGAVVSVPANLAQAGPLPVVFEDQDTIEEIIARFRVEMERLIAQAGVESRLTLTHAFQLVDVLLSNLETAYADSLELTFDKVDKQQAKLFNDLNGSMARIEDIVRTGEGATRDVTRELTTTMAALAPQVDAPVVFSYGPETLRPASTQPVVRVTVDGVNLFDARLNEKPMLQIGLIAFSPAEWIDSKLVFDVPRNHFAGTSRTLENMKALMTIPYVKLGVGSAEWRTRIATYPLRFEVLPRQLGTWQLAQEAKREIVREVLYRSSSFETKLVTTDNSPVVTATAHPADGCTFDLDTLDLTQTHRGYFSKDRSRPDDRYNNGTARFVVRNAKMLKLELWASPTTKHTSAESSASFTVMQLCPDTETLVYPAETGEISWTEDTRIRLQPDATSTALDVTLFDGVTRAVMLDGPRTLGGFVRVVPDLRNSAVLIQPVRE